MSGEPERSSSEASGVSSILSAPKVRNPLTPSNFQLWKRFKAGMRNSGGAESGGKWVRFDADSSQSTDINEPTRPAQIAVHIDETSSDRRQGSSMMSSSSPGPASPPGSSANGASAGLSNGRLLTSVPPQNHCLPWIVPAQFDPYKCPKSLVSDQLSRPTYSSLAPCPPAGAYGNGTVVHEAWPSNRGGLCPWLLPATFDPLALPKVAYHRMKMPVEDYVAAMEMLTNDFRFRGYSACYRRLIGTWLVLMFLLLCVILGAQVAKGVMLFVIVLIWMFLVAVGVLGVMLAKKSMYKSLHRCVASTNGLLLRHRLLVGMEDRGKLSCHKILVHFVYFDTAPCQERLRQVIIQNEQMRAARAGGSSAAAATPVASVSRSVAGAEEAAAGQARALLLKYSQSYVKSLVRKRLKFPARPADGVSDFAPLHCQTSLCPCQYVQRYHFERKGQKNCCERFFLVGDQNIADLEQPVYGAGAYPMPAMAYAHM